MAEVSIGDAVGAGFHLIRRRPFAVLTWGLPGLLVSAIAFGIFGSLYISIIGRYLHAGGLVNPMSSPAVMYQFSQMQIASLLINLASAFVNCVVFCAVFRSVIHPDQSRVAYLRVGAPEVFAFVLVIGGYIAFLVALFVPMLIVGVVVAGLAAAKAGAAAVIVGVLGVLAILVGVIYVALRLSLVVPMMVSDGKFHLQDAWALTKRHCGAILVVWIAVFAILVIAEIVVGLFSLAVGLGYLSSLAGGLSRLGDYFSQPPAVVMAGATPILLVFGLLSIPLTGCGVAIMGAPWARVYRDLSGPDLADTFS